LGAVAVVVVVLEASGFLPASAEDMLEVCIEDIHTENTTQTPEYTKDKMSCKE
jgi:hypothetical protein